MLKYIKNFSRKGSLMCLSYGMESGWISPMQPLLTSENPPVGTEPMTLDTIAWLGSISHLGAVIGTLIWSFVADRFGRKLATSLVTVPFIITWTLTLLAQNAGWLIVARFISGIGSSGSKINVLAFISELADDDVRGFFGSFPILFIDMGVLFSYSLGAYFKYYGIAVVGLAIPLVCLLTFPWLPESPVFLWKAGKLVDARKSLLWYKGGDRSKVEKTLHTYKLFPKNIKKSLHALFATRGTRKALVIGFSIVMALQTSGYYIIVSYAVSIFEASGGTSLSPHDSAILALSMQLIFSSITTLVIDHLGRKFLLVCSEAIMTFTLFSLGCHFFLIDNQSVDSVFRWAPVFLLCLHLAAQGLKAPVAFTIKAEIFPPEVKGLALSLMMLISSLLAFLFVKMFPAAKALWQLHGCFWILSGCSLFFAVYFAVYLPETKNKPQSVILLELNGETLKDVSNEELKSCTETKKSDLPQPLRSVIV